MDLNTWFVFIGVVALLIAFPGPSAILCLSHGVKFGRKRAVATILGGAFASLSLMLLSAIGLGAILAASETAFLVVKVLGAGYLIYLGVCAFFDKSSPVQNSETITADSAPNPSESRWLLLFKQGFTMGISNPKDLLFFAALFPSFIDLAQSQVMQFSILATSWLFIDFMIMYVYASVGNKIAPLFTKLAVVKAFNRTIGSFFVAVGGSILVSNK